MSKNNDKLTQLNYTTSHDLRAPVSNLISIFSLLDVSHVNDEETRQLIELLRLSAESMKVTLDNHVDEIKSQDSRLIELTDVSISDAIDTVKKTLKSLIRDAEATFHIDLSAFDSVRFNPKYLESIFLNFISNSIKYAHADRSPEIQIRTAFDEGRKALFFSDNGIGFDSKKQKDRVFGLNKTFHDNKDSKGIGLYLVYNHITSLGGSITVDSKIDAGTTFKITFRA
ncbi:MAG: HAMP domain-containing histidine kinase [Balneolales bacterium]|nr:HAMP domain-containing histidine kinase [Balneolales bacterium]